MKKGFNNNHLQNKNLNSTGQRILVQRLVEILDNKTIDTYKDRLNNIHGSLKELVSVCKKVQNGVLKDSHIDPVKLECQIKLGTEVVLRKYNSSIYNILNSRIKNKKGTLLNFINEIEVILKEIELNYLKWILVELKANIDNNDEENVNKLCENLITELILRGWTKYSLQRLINKMFVESDIEFNKKWMYFLEELHKEQVEFNFFIKHDSEIDPYFEEKLLEGKCILEKFPSINKSYIVDESKYIHIVSNSFEQDLNKASNDLVNELNAIEAEHIYCEYNTKIRKNDVITLLHNGRTIKYNVEEYNIRKSYEHHKLGDIKYNDLDKIRNNENIMIDTRSRINNVLMQYRLGCNTDSVETWFTSFWFALESLVVTEQYENIIEHIIEIVTPITTLKYPEKILINLIEDFERCGIKLDKYEIEYDGCVQTNIDIILDILKDKAEFDTLVNSIDNYDLLVLRLNQVRSIFKDSKSLKSYLETHHRNIEYHLRRLYRIRNSFVHNAIVEYDLYPLTMHLNSYLRDIIQEIVRALNCECYNDINLIYSCCKIRYESVINILKENGNSTYENNLVTSSYCKIN